MDGFSARGPGKLGNFWKECFLLIIEFSILQNIVHNWLRMPSCAQFSVYSTNICVTSFFFSNLVEHLSFCGHVVLVKEPLAVTNILVFKLKPRPVGTCPVIEQHYLRHNKHRNTNQLSDFLKNQIKYWFSLKMWSRLFRFIQALEYCGFF
jgi:hypothetical protein